MWLYVSFGAGVSSRARRVRRKKGRIAATAAILAATLAGASLAGAPAASASPGETVIVTSSGLLSPVTAVLDVGGTVLTQFHLITGVQALIPAVLEPVLAALPGITVTRISRSACSPRRSPPGRIRPRMPFSRRPGPACWRPSGDTGQGVTVAVVDTGIDNLPDFSGRLIGGVDLSGGNDPFQDGYGHGTFVAGLIAGNGASSNGQYSGEAPGARLVSIKVAGATGTTHLGTLILGLQWAVDHQRQLRHQGPQPVPRLPVQPVHGDQPAGSGGRGGVELRYHGRGLGGQRRALQRHHPVAG